MDAGRSGTTDSAWALPALERAGRTTSRDGRAGPTRDRAIVTRWRGGAGHGVRGAGSRESGIRNPGRDTRACAPTKAREACGSRGGRAREGSRGRRHGREQGVGKAPGGESPVSDHRYNPGISEPGRRAIEGAGRISRTTIPAVESQTRFEGASRGSCRRSRARPSPRRAGGRRGDDARERCPGDPTTHPACIGRHAESPIESMGGRS